MWKVDRQRTLIPVIALSSYPDHIKYRRVVTSYCHQDGTPPLRPSSYNNNETTPCHHMPLGNYGLNTPTLHTLKIR